MLRFLTAGEFHGPALTAIIEGFPAGVEVPTERLTLNWAAAVHLWPWWAYEN